MKYKYRHRGLILKIQNSEIEQNTLQDSYLNDTNLYNAKGL